MRITRSQGEQSMDTVATKTVFTNDSANNAVLLFESGLHGMLLGTRKRRGRELRRRLMDEILPQIARDGRYEPSRSVVDGQIVDRDPKPVNGTARSQEHRLTAEALYVLWCDSKLHGVELLPLGCPITSVAPLTHKDGERVQVHCSHDTVAPAVFALTDEIRIRVPETKMTPPLSTRNEVNPNVDGLGEQDTSIPAPRIARGPDPVAVNEVFTHQLGLAIAELESGQTDPVRTALRLELAAHVSGRDFGRYRDRLLDSFDDQTTVERSATMSQFQRETRQPDPQGVLEMAVEKLRGYLQTVRSASWKEAADATGLRRYMMRAAVAHMTASGELGRDGSKLALNAKGMH